MIWLVVVIAILILLTYFFTKRPEGFPPGPRGLPLFGYYPFFNKKRNYLQVEELAKQYGPVVGLYLGMYRAVFVNGWEACKEALLNDDAIGRPDICFLRDRFDGKNLGLIFVEGPMWKEHRRFALHHFRNLGFGKRSHADVIMKENEGLLKEISEKKGSFSLENPIAITVLNIMWSLLSGSHFSRSDPRLSVLMENIKDIMLSIPATGNFAIAMPFIRYIFPNTTGYNQVKRASKNIKEFLMSSIEEHKRNLNLDEEPKDFINIYLHELVNNNRDPSFTEDQLVALCMDLVAAAIDTSTATISFAIMFLCLNPDKQKKMQKELDEIVGPGRLPTVDDKSRLPFAEACVTETLRMRAPGPIIIPHRIIKDTTVQGYKIPAESGLLINAHSVHMDPDYYKNPHVFTPERFLTEDGKSRREERLLTFGKGKRSCLGEALAKMTSFLMVTALAHKFSINFAPGEPLPDSEGILGFTLAPPHYSVVVSPRW